MLIFEKARNHISLYFMLESEYNPPRLAAFGKSASVDRKASVVFKFALRAAVVKDLPDIREIYNYYVTNSVVTFDEDAMTIREWRIKFRYLEKNKMPFIVAHSPNGEILGYALVSPWKQKKAYRFTVENSIYLRSASLGKGLGKELLGALIEASKAAGLREMIAVIADSGAEASLRLHESFGFHEVGRMGRVGFKFGRWVGTVMMQRSLRSSPRSKVSKGLQLRASLRARLASRRLS
jgi:L-amino acid N-acyltransferase YncA